jgi:hypothetical protein
MSAAHTPGPWKWWTSCSFRRLGSEATGHDGDVLHAVIQRSDGHPDVHLPNGGVDGPDARLIAAAPELYEALLNLHRICLAMDLADQMQRPTEGEYQRALAASGAAIAKALGSAS